MTGPDPSPEALPVLAVIPAAGRSQRMGQPKQLLPFGERTILETVIETVLASPMNGLAVVTHGGIAEALDLAEDPRFVTVINDDAETQMLDSIRMGIDAVVEACNPPAECGICVCPGDMPRIDVAALTLCLGHFRQRADRIVVATFQDKRGHPIVFPRAMAGELTDITEGGLAELLNRHGDKVHPVECEPPGVVQDIDTPSDYQDLGPV